MIVLDAKTDYSFMRGFGTPEQWLARCKEIGVTHLGIADYCSTWGHTFFRKAFKDSGVTLLYGVQLPIVSKLDKDPRHSLVTLIAKKDVKPLYDLVTLAHQQSYYRPRITWDQLKGFEGTIIVDSLLPHHIKHPPKGSYRSLGVDAKLPLLPNYAPRFPGPDLRQGFKLFQAISDNQRIGEIGDEGLHMLRDTELYAKFPEAKDGDVTARLQKIVDATTATLPKGTLVDSGIKDKAGRLHEMAMDGALRLDLAYIKKTKHGNDFTWRDEAYGVRLDRELKVLATKGFEDYFFFVEDIVRWAKARMLVGPGRGSAGGSLVCYLLDITSVDPLKFGTMFERFIDSTRPDLPDIDIDFPDNRREEVFTYMREKYGEARVARLGTISEFGGKSAINDTAKATGVPIDVAREFGKYTEGVGQGVVISPARIMGLNEFADRGAMLSDEHLKMLEKYPSLKLAAMIDGHARHHGVHAAGVVVTQGPVTAFGALTKEGVLTMDMKAAEEIGLVKMDALGLRTLSVIQTACDLAGIDPKSLYDLDWEDTSVYDGVFNKDKMTGIFQFEGNAVRSLMKGLGKVERFDDICALTSLARPGPLIGGAAENWVKSRRGDLEPRILHASLESTFGVICYQEQMMQIMRDLGQMSEPDVQGARRAVGKKDPVKLKSYRAMFVKGAAGYFFDRDIDHPDRESAALEAGEALWDELEEFGSYAFNLAHAVEYAMISFMTAWLKQNHPLQFAAACLRYAVDDEQGKNLLRELKEEGFEYVPFDVEKSRSSWSIIDGKLYGGFDSVRGIGSKTADNLVAKRNLDPKKWLDNLTESQRGKLIAPSNTPWHTLTHFSNKFGALYADPEEFKPSYAPQGFKAPVLRIRDIPESKGNYAFIGRILKRQERDANDESRVAKRDGKVFTKDTFFINLTLEDDTGEIGATINRFKAGSFRWVLDESMEGRDFFFRGNIIGEGRRWVFIDNIVELKEKDNA